MDNLSVKSYLKSPALITSASLTVAFVLAYALDTALQQLQKYAETSFNFKPAVILSAIIPVVVVIGILALAWLGLRHFPPHRFTAFAFLISGLFVVGEYLSIFVSFPLWLRTIIIGRFRYSLMDLGTRSSIYYLPSACIAIGVAALRRHTVKLRDSSQDN